MNVAEDKSVLARSTKPGILIVCLFLFVGFFYLLFCAKEMKAKFAEFRPLFSRIFDESSLRNFVDAPGNFR